MNVASFCMFFFFKLGRVKSTLICIKCAHHANYANESLIDNVVVILNLVEYERGSVIDLLLLLFFCQVRPGICSVDIVVFLSAI